ncbi:hypothetical protein [Streptomyces durocortorensis]|uniref:Uncharacterized protein n=1 Tax=Streptomyces durocortorensis TaxID=2811104 RepID=A0ABS2I3Y5_9ACTN|nr:hypothetical protein [Streptomyces durocortorensis]MBM7057507.1 hypothetical protein [Streptomyces durocortorensis]
MDMNMGTRTAGIGRRREPRTGTANLLVFLGVLPLDILVGGYAWLAVGMEGWAAAHNGEDAVLPVTELLWSGGMPASIGLALCWGRFWAAAVAQFALTAVVMAVLSSSYG